MKTTHYGADGRVIAGNVPVGNMDEARVMALRWNRDESRPGMRVAYIVANDTGRIARVEW
jgi:hypothetical protein